MEPVSIRVRWEEIFYISIMIMFKALKPRTNVIKIAIQPPCDEAEQG